MATRIKTKTLAAVPQSKNDCAQSIRLLGDLQREFERERAAMNDAIGAITQQHQPKLSDLQQRIEAPIRGKRLGVRLEARLGARVRRTFLAGPQQFAATRRRLDEEGVVAEHRDHLPVEVETHLPEHPLGGEFPAPRIECEDRLDGRLRCGHGSFSLGGHGCESTAHDTKFGNAVPDVPEPGFD